MRADAPQQAEASSSGRDEHTSSQLCLPALAPFLPGSSGFAAGTYYVSDEFVAIFGAKILMNLGPNTDGFGLDRLPLVIDWVENLA